MIDARHLVDRLWSSRSLSPDDRASTTDDVEQLTYLSSLCETRERDTPQVKPGRT